MRAQVRSRRRPSCPFCVASAGRDAGRPCRHAARGLRLAAILARGSLVRTAAPPPPVRGHAAARQHSGAGSGRTLGPCRLSQGRGPRAHRSRGARPMQQPYNISRGPRGGVIMHLPDQAQPTELSLKGGPDGKNYIGPAEEPAAGAARPRDRRVRRPRADHALHRSGGRGPLRHQRLCALRRRDRATAEGRQDRAEEN